MLTNEEQEVMNLLVQAWTKFNSLPSLHNEELNDFRRVFHDLQRIIMIRPVLRDQAPVEFVVNHIPKEKGYRSDLDFPPTKI